MYLMDWHLVAISTHSHTILTVAVQLRIIAEERTPETLFRHRNKHRKFNKYKVFRLKTIEENRLFIV